MVTTLLDTAMGGACWSVLDEGESFLTADLRVEFMRSSRPGTLRAEGRVVQRNRRVAFCSAELYDADGDAARVVALHADHPARLSPGTIGGIDADRGPRHAVFVRAEAHYQRDPADRRLPGLPALPRGQLVLGRAIAAAAVPDAAAHDRRAELAS